MSFLLKEKNKKKSTKQQLPFMQCTSEEGPRIRGVQRAVIKTLKIKIQVQIMCKISKAEI